MCGNKGTSELCPEVPLLILMMYAKRAYDEEQKKGLCSDVGRR